MVVLLGGLSAERAISIETGTAVVQSLRKSGLDAHPLDVGADVIAKLLTGGFDRAFIALHGRGGEDGVMQGLLEMLGIPYTGSGVLGSALSMDKLRTKQIWAGVHIPTPSYVVLNEQSDFAGIEAKLGLPLMVKPVHEGSSLGMSKVEQAGQLAGAWRQAAQYDGSVIAEKFVQGTEYSASILNGVALPLIGLETPRSFYDYDAKYQADSTRYLCPCGLDGAREKFLQSLALKAFDASAAQGWGRIDLLLDEKSNPWFIEVNTVPGLTSHSLVPMAAKQHGVDFDQLVLAILDTSFAPLGGH